jgi:hypothetical protein
MARFCKKPVIVEAVRYTGGNSAEIANFVGKISLEYRDRLQFVLIETLEGEMAAKPGDWIIKGVNGEFYPCKPDIFDKTYEPVEE